MPSRKAEKLLEERRIESRPACSTRRLRSSGGRAVRSHRVLRPQELEPVRLELEERGEPASRPAEVELGLERGEPRGDVAGAPLKRPDRRSPVSACSFLGGGGSWSAIRVDPGVDDGGAICGRQRATRPGASTACLCRRRSSPARRCSEHDAGARARMRRRPARAITAERFAHGRSRALREGLAPVSARASSSNVERSGNVTHKIPATAGEMRSSCCLFERSAGGAARLERLQRGRRARAERRRPAVVLVRDLARAVVELELLERPERPVALLEQREPPLLERVEPARRSSSAASGSRRNGRATTRTRATASSAPSTSASGHARARPGAPA